MGFAPPPPDDEPDVGISETITPTNVSIDSVDPSSAQKKIGSTSKALSDRLRLDAERSTRKNISSINITKRKTAKTISTPDLQSDVRTQQNQNESVRLRPTIEKTAGTISAQARTRTDTEDISNLQQRIKASEALVKFSRIDTAKQSRKDIDDINRARTKVQRRCNHVFVAATQTCVFCEKRRKDHV